MFSRKFISFLVLLMFARVNASLAGYAPPTQNIIQSGNGLNSGPGFIFPVSQLSSVISIGGGSAASTDSNFYGLYAQSNGAASGQYQVPAGKTLYVTGIHTFSSTASVDLKFVLGYGTAALGSDDTATPPAGVVYYNAGGNTTKSVLPGGPGFLSIPVSFPAGAFPFFRMSGTPEVRIVLIGILQ